MGVLSDWYSLAHLESSGWNLLSRKETETPTGDRDAPIFVAGSFLLAAFDLLFLRWKVLILSKPKVRPKTQRMTWP